MFCIVFPESTCYLRLYLTAGFFSNDLSRGYMNLTEVRYLIIEKECLAVVWGIKRFKLYLAGRRFTLQKDHKPLRYMYEEK